MAWATIPDVLSVTGKTVTQEEVDRAHFVVEIHVSRTQGTPADALTARDEYWLKQAVAYQTAWMKAQPDFYERIEVITLLQDGVEVRDLPPDALTLAPMARRAIRRLSWRKSRSVHVVSELERAAAMYPVGGPVIDYPYEPWEHL
jgi:hypothetical protein